MGEGAELEPDQGAVAKEQTADAYLVLESAVNFVVLDLSEQETCGAAAGSLATVSEPIDVVEVVQESAAWLHEKTEAGLPTVVGALAPGEECAVYTGSEAEEGAEVERIWQDRLVTGIGMMASSVRGTDGEPSMV